MSKKSNSKKIIKLNEGSDNPISSFFEPKQNNEQSQQQEQEQEQINKIIDKTLERSFKKEEKILSRKNNDIGDVKEHQKYLIKLQRYGASERFSEYLKKMNFKLDIDHLKKLHVEELKEMLERVRITINSRDTNNMINGLVFSGTQIMETIAINNEVIKKYVNLKGFSSMLQNDESFKDIIEQLNLEYNDISTLSPEKRLGFVLVMTAMKCHGINKINDKFNSMGQMNNNTQPILNNDDNKNDDKNKNISNQKKNNILDFDLVDK